MEVNEDVIVTSNNTQTKIHNIPKFKECQYQSVRKVREESISTTSVNRVEEILQRVKPAKSFLYRNQNKTKIVEKAVTSYVPMDVGKKPKRFFRLSYEYPNFDLRKLRFSRQEKFNDRGYYCIKTTPNKDTNKVYNNVELKTKYKSFSNPEEFNDIVLEEHFYEDLCYNDTEDQDFKRNSTSQINNIKTHFKLVKIQDLFNSFKLPFFKKGEGVKNDVENVEKAKSVNENNESSCSMYDSVHVKHTETDQNHEGEASKVEVEDYLEPIKLQKDYVDVSLRERDEGILGYIMSIFENRFGIRRETSDPNFSEDSDTEIGAHEPTRTDSIQKWNDKNGKTNMADRPLPVPVDNEPYYMNIDRHEAELLLVGQPDGTFILRPSSQPSHAYTLSVVCADAVHNVGVRRRPDGRLALGFARRGERCFATIPSLLRHHRRRRLLLVAAGGVIGATTLKEPPVYYQTPSSLPVRATILDEATSNGDPEGGSTHHMPERINGKLLKRLETVPDIKRDTAGITTQYIAAGIVNLGALAAGVCVAWSSSALPLLIDKESYSQVGDARDQDLVITNETTTLRPPYRLTITENEASWVASLLCLGAFWGAVPAGLISEYFGRKKTLLYLALPLLVSWILVASSPNVYGLYVGRFVAGIAVGAFSVSIPPYVADIAERHLLASLMNFYHVLFTCGVLFGYIIGLVRDTSWLSFLCASIPISFFVAFLFLPESPTYLISQGKQSEAKAALRYFRGIDNDVDAEIKELKEHIRNYARNKVTFKELFKTRSTVKALIVSFGLMFFQQMSGIFPILFYAQKIFATFSKHLNHTAPIILGFFLVSSTYFSTMLLKNIRRRILLLFSFALMSIALGSLAIFYHMQASSQPDNLWVPLFTLCIFVTVYACGVGPIPWLIIREIFPANVTRRATAISVGFHWLLAFGVTKLFQNMVELVAPGWALWSFAVNCIFGLFFVYFFVPETKGRSLQDILNEFKGIHKQKKHRHVIEVESISET